MADIFDEISSIPDVAAFNAEIAEQPITQRVQAFLSSVLGAAYASAPIFTWSLPTSGEQIYGAIEPLKTGKRSMFTLHLVAERLDGTLAMAVPMPQEHESDAVTDAFVARASIRREQTCLGQILPALLEARDIVNNADIGRKQKNRVCSQLAHAAKHLEMYLSQQ